MGSFKSRTGARLAGKVALVTASTAGIGYAIAERFASEGAMVVLSSRKQANVDDCVARLQGLYGPDCCVGMVCHVAKAADRKALMELAIKTYECVDILVSNAAVNPGAGPILEMPESQIDKILEINVKAAVLLVQDVRPHMPDGGNIIFIASSAAFDPVGALGMYGVSKTALLGLTKALAAELAPSGIRVNCVAPGTVPTKFADALVSSNAARSYMEDLTLLKRLGRAEEIAAAVAFLASEDASYVTGETMAVTGGMKSRL
eukprot:TRINITY_DN23138_c0_g1_i1.p1 TRINITY_DN23138_c0_g1~~TRINITY_DN23138_c0_g1_i1.p1  ORF type:complete len:261 (+),score=45.88 TRINITY_DN23138_c0_g1_i1:310-1092(+)